MRDFSDTVLNFMIVALLSAMISYIGYAWIMTDERGLWPCEFEHSVECYWDASARGNGQGDSFWVDAEGIVHYIK